MLTALKSVGQSILNIFKSSASIVIPEITKGSDEDTVETNDTTQVLDAAVKPGKYSNISIVIDPGHGSKGKKPDVGAVGKLEGQYLVECDLVLEIAIRLAYILEKSGLKVILTRIDCEAPSSLEDKARIIKEENPTLMLSIHLNSNSGVPSEGIETYYNSKKLASKTFATAIQRALVESFSTHKDRGVKSGDKLYILRAHQVEACALVECEFINNPAQAKFIIDNYDEIAVALANGIYSYLDG